MLKKRIIPKLLLMDGRNVKGTRFELLRDTGNPITNARIYDAQGADELIFLDITPKNRQKKDILNNIIKKTAEEIFMPFCIGGGVTTVRDIHDLLSVGADKVSINTAAVETPEFIREASQHFGSQCVVVSIDVKKENDGWKVYTHGGRERTNLDVLEHAKNMVRLGAGELLVTSIDRDGTLEGFDINLINAVSNIVNVPVIASGGAGTLQHLVDAIKEGNASAVAIGSLFHFTDQSLIKARSFMKQGGLDVRT